LFVAILLISALFTACGNTDSQQRIIDAAASAATETESAETPKSETEQAVEAILSTFEEETEPDPLLERAFTFSDDDVALVRENIGKLTVEYPHANISEIKKAYARYCEQPRLSKREPAGLLADGILDFDELYAAVQNNNAEYKKTGIRNYTVLDDDYVRWVVEIICKCLNRELGRHDFLANMGELDSVVSNLKILTGIGLNNAAITDDGCLIITPQLVENMIWITGNDAADEITVAHECEHLLQKLSDAARSELGADRAYGFCRAFPDLAVNPLYFNWFLEASAEKLAIALYDSEPTTYTTKIGYLDSLTYIYMLDESIAPSDIPRLSEQFNLDRVFEMIGMDTDERKIEFLNMLWAINVQQESPKDFMAAYAASLGYDADYEFGDEEMSPLRVEMKTPALSTLSKYFYEVLADTAVKNSISLEDLFLLISVFEADMNYHVDSYTDEHRRESIEDMMRVYISAQDVFFGKIAEKLDVPADQICAAFNAYNAAIHFPATKSYLNSLNEDYTGVEILWLPDEENKFVTEQMLDVAYRHTISIRQMLEIFESSLTK
jgi:hypothetical protein